MNICYVVDQTFINDPGTVKNNWKIKFFVIKLMFLILNQLFIIYKN
jgi:hypothetical protein